jgi:hypothetical protein
MNRWFEFVKIIRRGCSLRDEFLEDLAIPLERVPDIREAMQKLKSFNWSKIGRYLGTNAKKTKECWEAYLRHIPSSPVPDDLTTRILACETFEETKSIDPEHQGARLEEIWRQKTGKRGS